MTYCPVSTPTWVRVWSDSIHKQITIYSDPHMHRFLLNTNNNRLTCIYCGQLISGWSNP